MIGVLHYIVDDLDDLDPYEPRGVGDALAASFDDLLSNHAELARLFPTNEEAR